MVIWDMWGESRNKSQEIHDRSRIIFHQKKVQISLNNCLETICLETVKKLKSSNAEETVFTQQICILPKPIFIV